MILGRPVYVSAEYPENLDSNGVVSDTDANNTKTGFTHVNRVSSASGMSVKNRRNGIRHPLTVLGHRGNVPQRLPSNGKRARDTHTDPGVCD